MEELWRFQVRILLLERNIRVRLDSVMLVYRAGIKCREGNRLFVKEKHFEGNLMCVFVSVRVCACSGIVFHRCRKHTYTDDCHSNRSGGRRKLWCSWVIFSWTLCSLQHESFSKLYKNFSNEKKKVPSSFTGEATWVSSPATVTDDTSCMFLRRRCSLDVRSYSERLILKSISSEVAVLYGCTGQELR